MSHNTISEVSPPRDHYHNYYTEKLWEWIPALYKSLDYDPPASGVLRAMIEIVAGQAAILRRDVDRIWDDQSIELADEWALAYLGTLVGATPVSEFNERGQRLSIANAIRYQRRKGTMTVLQELIRDIGGLEGVVTEAFRRLVRFPHRLDIDALGFGKVTSSPAGGFINLRNARVAGLNDSAFDETAHFMDIRRLKGPYGRYGIRKANFHLYPFRSYSVFLSTPLEIAAGRWTLDPSGRDVPLFQRGQTSDRPPDAIREVDLPDIILCRRFNAAQHQITLEALAEINNPALNPQLAPLLNLVYPTASSFLDAIEARLLAADFANFAAVLLDATQLPESFKSALWHDSIDLIVGNESTGVPLPGSAVIAANLSEWGATTPFSTRIALVFDPDTGRMIEEAALPAGEIFTSIHFGMFSGIGAGPYARAASLSTVVDSEFPAGATGIGGGFTSHGPQAMTIPATGVHRLTTSKTYEPQIPLGAVYDNIEALYLEADDGVRPFLLFRPDTGILDITFRAAAPVNDDLRELTIDGLWLGIIAETIVAEAVANQETAATPIAARIILDGSFDRVVFRNATIDPGGERSRNVETQAIAIPYIRLEIAGQIETLEISRCITGPVWESNGLATLCNIGRIEISDSIVYSLNSSEPAIMTRLGELSLERSTVIGNVDVSRLYATDSIVAGRIRVTDNQHGCFRYSATGDYLHLPVGDQATLPARFEDYLFDGEIPLHVLLSQRFGNPQYGALSATAPQALKTGAANGSEMGAFNKRGLGVMLNDLERKVHEFLPIGVQPQYVVEHQVDN